MFQTTNQYIYIILLHTNMQKYVETTAPTSMGASLFEKDAMDGFFSHMFFPFPPQFFAGKFTYGTSLGELQGG